MKFICSVNRNQLHPQDPVGFDKFLLGLKGKKVIVDIKKKRKPTTNEQYGYLYGCIYAEISEYTGHTVDEVDYFFRMKYHFKVVEISGYAVKVPKSLSKIKAHREELAQFIDKIIMFMAPYMTISKPN